MILQWWLRDEWRLTRDKAGLVFSYSQRLSQLGLFEIGDNLAFYIESGGSFVAVIPATDLRRGFPVASDINFDEFDAVLLKKSPGPAAGRTPLVAVHDQVSVIGTWWLG